MWRRIRVLKDTHTHLKGKLTQLLYHYTGGTAAACKMDAIVQLAHQTEVHRLKLYHDMGGVFPYSLGTEAEELYTTSDQQGPCLLLLRGVTAAPAALNNWLSEVGLVWACTRIYWLGSNAASSRQQLVEQLLAQGPPPSPIRLQCFPRSMETWLAAQLQPHGFVLHPVAFEHVLHVVEMPGPPGQPQLLRHCLQPAEGLFKNASEGPSRIPGELSKAAGKLAEALMLADCIMGPAGSGDASREDDSTGAAERLRSSNSPADGSSGSHSRRALGTAIDVGAAPGSWTALLAQRAQQVVAIDPAELDPSLTDGSGGGSAGAVVHLRCKVEEAGEALEALLGPGGQADLVVSDVNRHPDVTAPMVKMLARHMKPGGLLVLTLKFFGRGRDRDVWQQRMEEMLQPEFEGVRVVWLLANTQNERTCLALRSACACGDGTAAGA